MRFVLLSSWSKLNSFDISRRLALLSLVYSLPIALDHSALGQDQSARAARSSAGPAATSQSASPQSSSSQPASGQPTSSHSPSGKPTGQIALSHASRQPDVLPREAAELEIALGRIRLVPDRFRIVRRHDEFEWPSCADEASAAGPGTNISAKSCSRSLQVATHEGRPTLKLSYSDPSERWTLTVDAIVGAHWTRELLDCQPIVKVEYMQRPHQPIVVSVVNASTQPIQISGATLWHLTEQKSPEFERYVLPALVRLNPVWDLPQALAAARRMRGYGELGKPPAAQYELAQLIAQLDSSDRRVREVAKQKLRETGLAAQIPLEELRNGPLTIQQRSTVAELLAELEPRSADTPTRLAYWLSGDPNWR